LRIGALVSVAKGSIPYLWSFNIEQQR